jgi:hypothetical protein
MYLIHSKSIVNVPSNKFLMTLSLFLKINDNITFIYIKIRKRMVLQNNEDWWKCSISNIEMVTCLWVVFCRYSRNIVNISKVIPVISCFCWRIQKRLSGPYLFWILRVKSFYGYIVFLSGDSQLISFERFSNETRLMIMVWDVILDP